MNPRELTDLDQWVIWKREKRNGKITKPPRNAHTGEYASTTDASTWASYEEAQQAVQRLNMAGCGFVFTPNDDLAGIDIDNCRNPETGVIQPWARTIVDDIDSYTEVSPSKTGVKVFVRATLTCCRRRKGGVEVYDRGRFFTVTGEHLEGTPTTVEERDAQVKLLCERLFGSNGNKPNASTSPVRTGEVSEELIEKAKAAANGDKFSRLWEGNTTEYDSPSEADLALVDILRFWAQGDRSLIDNLFRQSGLFREKWDEIHSGDGRTYGEITIDTALDGRGETYQPDANATNVAPKLGDSIGFGLSPATNVAPPTQAAAEPKPLKELTGAQLLVNSGEAPAVDFLPMLGREGFIVKGWSHILASYPKTGKTELLADSIIDWTGQGLRILYFTEESEAIWRLRLPLRTPATPENFTLVFALMAGGEAVEARIRAGNEDIVIVDTLRNILGLENEMDNSAIARAIAPLVSACEPLHQTLVLSSHHIKAGGEHGRGIAGGHAFLGAVDIAIEMTREQPPNRRRLEGMSRIITIPSLLYEMGADRAFKALGSPSEVSAEEVMARTLEVLTEDWQSTAKIRESLGEPLPAANTVLYALRELAEDGMAERDPPIEEGYKMGARYKWRAKS